MVCGNRYWREYIMQLQSISARGRNIEHEEAPHQTCKGTWHNVIVCSGKKCSAQYEQIYRTEQNRRLCRSSSLARRRLSEATNQDGLTIRETTLA